MKGYADRDARKENEREEKIKEKLDCKFIRINPDEQGYDGYVKFRVINNRISESNKKLTKISTKISLIDKSLKRPLELEFKEKHSIK